MSADTLSHIAEGASAMHEVVIMYDHPSNKFEFRDNPKPAPEYLNDLEITSEVEDIVAVRGGSDNIIFLYHPETLKAMKETKNGFQWAAQSRLCLGAFKFEENTIKQMTSQVVGGVVPMDDPSCVVRYANRDYFVGNRGNTKH